MIRYFTVLGVGYVLGTKAGRQRYEQLSGMYRTLTGSPAAKSAIEVCRRKIAERVSPDASFVTLTAIDETTTILEPEKPQSNPR